ncbi:putative prohead core protein [Erwinia phage phiEa2809]|uniref:Putative prohead core protein n=1 Tax=Erwinia phage phiEa2809 TaxID=1564096 RepID=A0A0A0YXJ3_9CAUD|nr:head scaffolding protein [Erwinia phage phiEa2809]AIX13118.1 putative prohead core protein [Erwinia phage phiEa2809]
MDNRMPTFADFLAERQLTEQGIIDKVNAKGKRRRRLKCGPGFKLSADGTRCEVMDASQRRTLKMGNRKALRSKKRMGMGYQKKIVRRQKKAMRFRKMMGLK